VRKGYKFLLLTIALALPSFANSFYVGTDTGCFYPFFSPTCTLTGGESSLGSTLSGAPLITYTPDSGFSAPASGGVVELGTFSVNDTLLGGEGGNFDIQLDFTAPGGVGSYTATTFGLVVLGAGGAEVTFNNPGTELFNYAGGEFAVSLPTSPIQIGAGKSVVLDALITPVPEPASVASVVVALILITAVYRRRRAPNARRA